MKKLLTFLSVGCLVALSCTKEKTDYEAAIDAVAPEHAEFKEAATIRSGGYDIRIETLNGTFYKGYNEIRLKITNSATSGKADVTGATFSPITTDADGGTSSCPHRYELTYRPDSNYFSGYSVFTSERQADDAWVLDIGFT